MLKTEEGTLTTPGRSNVVSLDDKRIAEKGVYVMTNVTEFSVGTFSSTETPVGVEMNGHRFRLTPEQAGILAARILHVLAHCDCDEDGLGER